MTPSSPATLNQSTRALDPARFFLPVGYSCQLQNRTLDTQRDARDGAYWSPWRVKDAARWQRHIYALAAREARAAMRNPARDPARPVRVLDVGCGVCVKLVEHLLPTGAHVVGIDQASALAVARSLGCRSDLHPVNLESPSLDLGCTFDVILCADVLEHLRDPAALLRALRPLLAAEGVLVASLPNSGHWYFRLNVLMGRFPRQDKGLFDRTHLQFCMWTNWVELFESAGLQATLSRLTVPPLELRFPRSAGALWLRLANRSSAFLAWVWKELFAYQFVVMARPAGGET